MPKFWVDAKKLAMKSIASDIRPISPPAVDPAVGVYAEILRGVIERIPMHLRDAVFNSLADLLQKPKVPQRGGALLNNVIHVFKSNPGVERGAAEVIAALAEKNISAEIKPIYNVLNYLNGMNVIRRVGYGRYLMVDGSIIDGPP